jgi:hypothetical protein
VACRRYIRRQVDGLAHTIAQHTLFGQIKYLFEWLSGQRLILIVAGKFPTLANKFTIRKFQNPDPSDYSTNRWTFEYWTLRKLCFVHVSAWCYVISILKRCLTSSLQGDPEIPPICSTINGDKFLENDILPVFQAAICNNPAIISKSELAAVYRCK